MSTIDTKTGLTSELTLKVFVKCLKGFTTAAPLNDISYLIDIDTLWALPFTLPTFTPTPPLCDFSSFVFTIKPTPLPVWLTETSPNNWQVETQDREEKGFHYFTIIANDPVEGITYSGLDSFKIEIIKPFVPLGSLSLVLSTAMTDQDYWIGATPLVINFP